MRTALLYFLVLCLTVGAIAGIGVYKWWFPCPDPIQCPTTTTVDVDSLRTAHDIWRERADRHAESVAHLLNQLDSIQQARQDPQTTIDNATRTLDGAPVQRLVDILDQRPE